MLLLICLAADSDDGERKPSADECGSTWEVPEGQLHLFCIRLSVDCWDYYSNWTEISPTLPQLITHCFAGSGADLWEVHQTAGYEWGVGHEDALPQLCAAEMWLFPERATGQTWWPNQEVKYYIYATVKKFGVSKIVLFRKDALNWLKVAIKIFML